jgi:hypothetical protein
VPSTDGGVVRKVVSTCRAIGDDTATEMTIVRRASGFLTELTLITSASVSALSDQSKSERSALANASM